MLRLMICYVFKARTQESRSWADTSETYVCFIAVTGPSMRGGGVEKAPGTSRCNGQMTEGKTGRRKGSSDAGRLEDAAQGATHLDVLACAIAS